MTAALIGYYTITPTHCGTGQAADAVDLPIAREAHTGHPIFPATSIKGSIRDVFEQPEANSKEVENWFGPRLVDPGDADSGGAQLRAGAVTFGEGRLLAFPVRCLHTSFCYVTCPLVIERFRRDLCAHGLQSFWGDEPVNLEEGDLWRKVSVLVSPALHGELREAAGARVLVLEDLAFDTDSGEIAADPVVESVAQVFAKLLPKKENSTRSRLTRQLVVIRDEFFQDLVRRTTPVQARVALTENKTTSNGGNLWYEETLPSDSLLSSFVGLRRQRSHGGASEGDADRKANAGHREFWEQLVKRSESPLQIGGNETVGLGLCLWTISNTGVHADG
jgi:CRISPR-associated protein Cmr4